MNSNAHFVTSECFAEWSASDKRAFRHREAVSWRGVAERRNGIDTSIWITSFSVDILAMPNFDNFD